MVEGEKNMHKKSFGSRMFDTANILFMLSMIVVTIYPFWYVLMASLSDSNLLMAHSGFLFTPLGFTIGAYKMVIKNPNIITGYANTIFVVFTGTLLSVLMTALGAYVFSRRSFPFKKTMLLLIIFTMYFQGGLIPSYLLVNNTLGLGDNRWALILPAMISTWNLIVMRSGFAAIPEALEESARIDGANDPIILFRIIIPVSLPVVAVIILFYGVSYWNSWFGAMVYLRERSKFPLQLILREILVSNSTESMMVDASDTGEAISRSIRYATIVVSTIPILFIYPALQKYFIKGIMVGAVKG